MPRHGDPVAHGDGAEHLRHCARRLHRPVRPVRQNIQAGIAGSNGAIAVRDADYGLLKVPVAEPHRPEHRAVGGPLHALGDEAGAAVLGFGFIAHEARKDGAKLLNRINIRVTTPLGQGGGTAPIRHPADAQIMQLRHKIEPKYA